MKQRQVIYTPAAQTDLLQLLDRLLEIAGPAVAFPYVGRLQTFIDGLEYGSQRGTLRKDVSRGLRVIGFERRVSIAFKVYDNDVVIVRIFSGGQNWQDILNDEEAP